MEQEKKTEILAGRTGEIILPPTKQAVELAFWRIGRIGEIEIALKSRLKSSRKFWGLNSDLRPKRCFLQSFASRAI